MKVLRVFRHAFHLGSQDVRIMWSSWRVWMLTHVVRVLTTACMWVLLGTMVGSDDQVRYLLIGQIVIVGAQYTGWTVAAFTWDRMFIGTYPMLIAAPSSLVPAMMGRTSVWLLHGIVTSWVTLGVLAPLFGLSASRTGVVGIAAGVVTVCISFYGFAFTMGTLVNWRPRFRNVAHNSASIVIMAISGVVVPVAFWPEWVQTVAGILPVTHGLAAIRLMVDTGWSNEVLRGIGLEVLVGMVWLTLGLLLLDRTVDVARRNGRIELI